MGRRTLEAAIEQQSGACRQLSICLNEYAKLHRTLLVAERTLLIGYADSMRAIADGLTKALADDDRSTLRKLWRWAPVAAGHVALAFATGSAEGVTGFLVESEHVHSCTVVVVDNAEQDDAMVGACLSRPSTPAAQPSSTHESDTSWFKSSYSSNGSCVEVSPDGRDVLLRDSKRHRLTDEPKRPTRTRGVIRRRPLHQRRRR